MAGGLATVGVVAASTSGRLLTVLLAAAVLGGLGLIDDRDGVGPVVKIVVEVGCAPGALGGRYPRRPLRDLRPGPDAHGRLGGGRHERDEHDRQHGRALLGARRAGVAHVLPDRGGERRLPGGLPRRGARGRDPRLPPLQLPPRVDLPGRRGNADDRVPARGRLAPARPRRRDRSGARRDPGPDPRGAALRHGPGDRGPGAGLAADLRGRHRPFLAPAREDGVLRAQGGADELRRADRLLQPGDRARARAAADGDADGRRPRWRGLRPAVGAQLQRATKDRAAAERRDRPRCRMAAHLP